MMGQADTQPGHIVDASEGGCLAQRFLLLVVIVDHTGEVAPQQPVEQGQRARRRGRAQSGAGGGPGLHARRDHGATHIEFVGQAVALLQGEHGP